MDKGPVAVIATEYGTRLDNQPVSRSATVDGVPDFVNLYEYDYQWSGAYNGDGTTSTSETSSNNVSGSGSGSSTHNWSWSYEGSCASGSGSGGASGSGCASGSGSSGTSSSNWSDSYDETVSYPGFYSGAYYSSYGYGSGGGYAGDEPLDYIGDDFSYSSGSGYGGESGSGNGEGSQGDEGQPPFLEWELRGAFLEEWDELREHLARENALREQMWEDADQLWEELDRINRSRGGPYDWGFDGDSRIDHWFQYLQPENRERLARVLEEVAKAWAVPIGGEHCHRWVEDARQRIVALGTDFYENEDYSIKYAEWSFDPRLNDGWEEHAALMIEFTDGLIFYVDNGALGTGEYNVFLPRDIPKDRNWRESVNHGLDIDPPLEKVPLGLLRNAWERVKSLFR